MKKKTTIILWRYGKKEPDPSPMVVTHMVDELPKFIMLASFENPDVLRFKLIEMTFKDMPVYYETFGDSQL